MFKILLKSSSHNTSSSEVLEWFRQLAFKKGPAVQSCFRCDDYHLRLGLTMLQLETLQTVGWDIHRVGSFVDFEMETKNPKEQQLESENQQAS
jgi:hypothetical protein